MNGISNNFPYFKLNPEAIYFDNASTTQKPKVVLDAINDYFTLYCANAGRGSYATANKVTQMVEEVRAKVKQFINADNVEEIVFTSGTTESLNTVAYAWGLCNLKTGDEVLACFEDHDSGVLPWINLKNTLAKFGIHIKIIPFKNTPAGDANIEDIILKVNEKTRLIALTHVHNVYGVKTDIDQIREKINKDIFISLDAAQSIGHIPVDVKKLGVDFISFSGHKMFASTGVGVLWIKKRVHNQIYPFLVGGGVTKSKSGQDIIYKNLPYLLEGGTVNLAGIISLGSAIDFINKIGIEKIHDRILGLSQYLLCELRQIQRIEFLPGIAHCKCAVGYGIISFNIEGLSSNEIGFILNDRSIYVRTGSHCTGSGSALNDSIRVSLHIYNTEEEIRKLIKVTREII